jgi:hypothetical protein
MITSPLVYYRLNFLSTQLGEVQSCVRTFFDLFMTHNGLYVILAKMN